jgi:hypothetical protein
VAESDVKNSPVTGSAQTRSRSSRPSAWQVSLLALLLLIAIIVRRNALAALKEALRPTNAKLGALLVVVSIGCEALMTRDAVWPSLAATALPAAAVLLEIRKRGRPVPIFSASAAWPIV